MTPDPKGATPSSKPDFNEAAYGIPKAGGQSKAGSAKAASGVPEAIQKDSPQKHLIPGFIGEEIRAGAFNDLLAKDRVTAAKNPVTTNLPGGKKPPLLPEKSVQNGTGKGILKRTFNINMGGTGISK